MRVPRPPTTRATVTIRQISYSVDKSDFDRVAATLDVGPAAEVGRRTFDHFLRTQVPPLETD